MRISLFMTICLFVCSVHAANTKLPTFEPPKSIPFKTEFSKELQINHKVKHQVTLNYFHAKTKQVLLTEKFSQVEVFNNQLKLELGTGLTDKGGFDEVIKNNPELKLSVRLNGEEMFPYVGLLPAGHSIETAMIASNTKSGKDGIHRKGYEVKGSVSSIQAVVLSKNRPQSQGDIVRTNPYQADVIGPYLSEPVRSLPLAIKQPVQARETNALRHENLYDKNGKRFGTATEKVVDTLASNSSLSNLQGNSNTPDLLVNFEGMDNISGASPPDIEGTVGPNHFVQMVNVVFAVYDKTGTQIQAPVNINTLWAGFGGACESNNSGDPIAIYDEQADKFLLTQFAVTNGNLSVCFAVSETPDPTGAFYLYELQAQRFPDFFKIGVWPVASNNMYTLTTNTGMQGAYDVYALDRENMIAGNAARPAQFFQNHPNLLMPADNDGMAPPSGSPALLYTIRDGGEAYFSNPPEDSIDIYEYDIDWDTPANSSLSLVQLLTPSNGDLTDFNWTVCGFFVSDCLPQPGTSQLIDSGSWWPQQRFQYRNFGTHEALVGTWIVDVNGTGDRAAPRWFELRRNLGDSDWDMHQEGTFSPDATNRFLSSISMDASGNIGLGYSVSSGSQFPSIRYTVHDVDNTPLGSLEVEKVMKEGTGSETGANRWGDYASMEIDPADGCTFWFASEYIETTGDFNWQTYVGSFKMPNCVITALDVASSEIEVCESDPSASYSLTVSNAFAGTTDMTASTCPAGGSCDFMPNPLVSPADSTGFQVTNLSSIGAGSYPFTLTATDSVDGLITASNDVVLDIFSDITVAPNLIFPAHAAYAGSLTPMLEWDNASGGSDFLIEVDDDPSFSSVDFTGMTANSILNIDSIPLNESTCYYWRVSPSNVCGSGASSAVNNFYTGVAVDSGNLMSTNVPVTISSTVVSTVTSELVVSGVGIFSDIDLVDLTIQHTYINDLSLQLTSPEGTTVTLMSASCFDEDNFDLTLDDEAAPGDWPCPPTDGGSYQPSNPLSSFDGENADGIWVLSISDSFQQDGGSLDTWGLKFLTTSDPGNQCDATAPPTAVSDQLSVTEDSTTNTLDVLGNDTDPDGGKLTITSVSQGSNNGVVVNNGSDVSYTPEIDFCGMETFTYTLNGGSIGDVEVDVTCVNDKPSMVVTSAVYVNLTDIANPPVQNLACQFDFGPDNEDSSQAVNDMVVNIGSDLDGILSSFDVDNSGQITYIFTGESGVAEVSVAIQDDGGVDNGGVDTSQEYSFTINVQDYVFRTGFEMNVCQ